MTRDDIIKLMQQACDPDKKPAWHNEFWTITQQELERFADFVAKAEREECAMAHHRNVLRTQPLTDEEILEAWKPFEGNPFTTKYEFARAIERAHGIGEKK